MQTDFTGLGVALVTPFDADGRVDFAGLKRLVEFNISGGVDYLVVLGTTAETATLTVDEQQAVISSVIETNQGRKPVVLGLGGNNTRAICDAMQQGNFEGIDAFLSVSPYYNKPTQEGIYQHFKAVAQSSPLPIILYNVPGRTSSNMSASTTLRLANEFKNIVAIKEASGNMEQCMEILRDKPEGFHLISGEDSLTLPLTLMGGSGVISVVGELIPELYSKMVHLALDRKTDEANSIHLNVLKLTQLLFSEGNPAGVKAGLHHRGVCKPFTRLPLVPMSEAGSKEVQSALDALI